jgi:hypothetical protein
VFYSGKNFYPCLTYARKVGAYLLWFCFRYTTNVGLCYNGKQVMKTTYRLVPTLVGPCTTYIDYFPGWRVQFYLFYFAAELERLLKSLRKSKINQIELSSLGKYHCKWYMILLEWTPLYKLDCWTILD